MTDTKPTQREVLEYFFSLPPEETYRFRWVLSQETVDHLCAQAPELIPHGWPITELQLVGKPIRIDDSACGLHHEDTTNVVLNIRAKVS